MAHTTTRRTLAALLLMACLWTSGGLTVFASEAAGTEPVPDSLLSYTATPVGWEQLSDEELAHIEGKGFLSAVQGGLLGAAGGYMNYTINYYWDRHIDHEQRSWSWSEAVQETVSTAAVGFTVGFFAPSP